MVFEWNRSVDIDRIIDLNLVFLGGNCSFCFKPIKPDIDYMLNSKFYCCKSCIVNTISEKINWIENGF